MQYNKFKANWLTSEPCEQLMHEYFIIWKLVKSSADTMNESISSFIYLYVYILFIKNIYIYFIANAH